MKRSRSEILGTGTRGMNNPITGILTGGNITAIDLNDLLTDIVDSMFILESDDADDINNGVSNSFLTDQAQDIFGIKSFKQNIGADRGISLKGSPADTGSLGIKVPSSFSSSYNVLFPDALPNVGESLSVASINGTDMLLEWASGGAGTIQAGIPERLAIYRATDTLGSVSNQSNRVTIPSNETAKHYEIPSIGTPSSSFFMMTDMDTKQEINGVKEFKNGVEISSFNGTYTNNVLLNTQPLNGSATANSSYSLTFGEKAPDATTGANSFMTVDENGVVNYVTIGQPTSSNDGNSIRIFDGELRLSYATEYNDGIVSKYPQVFNGEKYFVRGLSVRNNESLSLEGSDPSKKVSLTASPTISSSYQIVLPPTNGTADQILKLNAGATELEWVDLPTGGGGSTNTIENGSTGYVPLYKDANTLAPFANLGGNANIGVKLEAISNTGTNSIISYRVPNLTQNMAGISSNGIIQFVLARGDQFISDVKTFNNDVKLRGNLIFEQTTGIQFPAGGVISSTSTQGITIGLVTTNRLGFYGAAPIERPTALPSSVSLVTNAGLPASNTSPWGFTSQADMETLITALNNTQARLNALEARLSSATGLGLIA